MRFLLLTMWLLACAENEPTSKSSAGDSVQATGHSTETEREYGYKIGMQGSCYEAEKQPSDVCYRMGMRNFREINATLSRLTGVSYQTGEVRKAYHQVEVMLPRKNSLDGFLGAVPVGIFRLASAYCNQLVNGKDMEEVQRQRFPTIDFNGKANVALALPKRSVVANAFIDAFWGKNIVSGKDRDNAVAHLVAYIDDTLQEATHRNSVKGTRNTLLGACTAMLSSAPVIFY